MRRGPIVLEGKSIDFGLSLLFAFIALVSMVNTTRAGSEVQRIESFAAIPLLITASYSLALRQVAKVPAFWDETVIPMLSFFSPFLALNAGYLQADEFSLPMASLIAIPGITLSCISMIYLRSSFSILPSVRKLVRTGPYRFIRHPIYLGESLYVFGVMMLAFSLLSILLFAVLIVLFVARIRIEERKLMVEPSYARYTRNVKYRLIPLLY